MEDHQIDVIHKADTVDQLVRLISTETIKPDQTLIEVINLILIEIVHTQFLDIDNVLTIVDETLKRTQKVLFEQS